jgi:hypothetical protein
MIFINLIPNKQFFIIYHLIINYPSFKAFKQSPHRHQVTR